MLSLVRPSREWVNSDNRRQMTEDAGQMGTTGVWSAIGRQFTRRPSSVVRPLSSGSFTVWTLTAGFSLERDDFSSNRQSRSTSLFEHDLFQKPVSTFRDHALEVKWFD